MDDEELDEEVHTLLANFVDPATEDIIPAQPLQPLTGERLLLYCILDEVRTSLTTPRGILADSAWEDAYNWLMTDDDDSQNGHTPSVSFFTMQSICERLGLHPQWVRRKILQQVPKHVWRQVGRIPPGSKSRVRSIHRYVKGVRM